MNIKKTGKYSNSYPLRLNHIERMTFNFKFNYKLVSRMLMLNHIERMTFNEFVYCDDRNYENVFFIFFYISYAKLVFYNDKKTEILKFIPARSKFILPQ